MALDEEPPVDSKTALQEWAQRRQYVLPEYKVVSQEGPAHSPKFLIEVCLGKFEPRTGYGTSKRQAEQMAAKSLLAEVIKGQEC